MATAERRRLSVIGRDDEPDWMIDAKCRGITATSLFYPDRSNDQVMQAKAVCKGEDGSKPCPVLQECFDYAMDTEEKFGVWGGTSERERRRIKKARLAQSARQQRMK